MMQFYADLLTYVDVNALVSPKAVVSVVRLHEPQLIVSLSPEFGWNCRECDNLTYPCPTIDAIYEEIEADNASN